MPWEMVRRRIMERLRERGFDDLDVAHLTVFLFPGPHGARPSELAARLGASKQSINHVLGQLERLRYIERLDDSEDLRSRRIHVTARGRSAGLVMRDAVKEVEVEWEQRLGKRGLATLRRLLLRLCAPEPTTGPGGPHRGAVRPGGSPASSSRAALSTAPANASPNRSTPRSRGGRQRRSAGA
jgi:DNA-binding MarR family transcriptional regulator